MMRKKKKEMPPGRDPLFEELYQTYKGDIRATIRMMLCDPETEQDLAQETFLKISKNLDRFRDEDEKEARALIRSYARNTAIDYLRRQDRRSCEVPMAFDLGDEETERDFPDPSPTPDECAIGAEEAETLARYINRLTEEQRQVLWMKYYRGMNNRQIAKKIGIDESAVGSRLRRALTAIRRMIGEEKHGVFEEKKRI